MNTVNLTGRLVKDPELNKTNSGKSVTNFTIAMNRKYKSNDETREETTFIDLVAWGNQAEFIAEKFVKAKPIVIEGSLFNENWETEEGKKRSRTKVRVNRASFVLSDNTREETATASATAGSAGSSNDDDIPF